MRKTKILIVDDDIAASRLLALGLEKTGLFSALVEKGYHVIPQVGSEGFAIDLVVEG